MPEAVKEVDSIKEAKETKIDDSAAPVKKPDVAVPVPPSEKPDAVTPSEKPDGVTPSEKSDGVTLSEKPDAVTPSEKSDEVTPSNKPDGVNPSDKPDEVTPSEKPDAAAPLVPSKTLDGVASSTKSNEAAPEPQSTESNEVMASEKTEAVKDPPTEPATLPKSNGLIEEPTPVTEKKQENVDTASSGEKKSEATEDAVVPVSIKPESGSVCDKKETENVAPKPQNDKVSDSPTELVKDSVPETPKESEKMDSEPSEKAVLIESNVSAENDDIKTQGESEGGALKPSKTATSSGTTSPQDPPKEEAPVLVAALENDESMETSEPKDEQNGHKETEGAGETVPGRSTEADPGQVEELQRLIREAKEQMAVSEFFSAADLFGNACEIAGKLYGELANENAELYFSYGCAMLECAKNENTVLGEAVKDKDEADDEEDDDAKEDNESDNQDEPKADGKVENGDVQVNGDEKMEVLENGENGDGKSEEDQEEMDADVKDEEKKENGVDSEQNEEETKENEEDEDSSLKTAWEMFELAKVIFTKTGNDLKLSDTYIKLGEVGMESGHEEAIEDMKRALELRLKCAPENERLLAETHFNIGLAYSTFQKFDNAIESFSKSKSMIEEKINKLKVKVAEETKDAEAEIKELTELLPDLDEKVQDMKDSKEAKIKNEQDDNGSGQGSSEAPKAVSNITHLVKRKRKLEDVASDLLPNSKQTCTGEDKAKETPATE